MFRCFADRPRGSSTFFFDDDDKIFNNYRKTIDVVSNELPYSRNNYGNHCCVHSRRQINILLLPSKKKCINCKFSNALSLSFGDQI